MMPEMEEDNVPGTWQHAVNLVRYRYTILLLFAGFRRGVRFGRA